MVKKRVKLKRTISLDIDAIKYLDAIKLFNGENYNEVILRLLKTYNEFYDDKLKKQSNLLKTKEV